MKPVAVLSDKERSHLKAAFSAIEISPYKDYPAFREEVAAIVQHRGVPDTLHNTCTQIGTERADGTAYAHVVRNCPVDDDIPLLHHDDPSGDKRARKTTFVGEAFLELFAQVTGTPLLAYAARFGGDFFTDVIAINRYRGQQTGYSDGEVVYHNDRTAHPVRADYITLLGMRCPPEELVYTGFISTRDLLKHLDPGVQSQLREAQFVTPLDIVSRDAGTDLETLPAHAILGDDYTIRYLDTHTTVSPGAPPAATDALLALKNALTRGQKTRHRLLVGDVLTFANQRGLHNREHIDITDPERAFERWLLKTYAFSDEAAAARYADAWVDGIPGKVAG